MARPRKLTKKRVSELPIAEAVYRFASKPFKKELQLCDYIEANIKSFTEDILSYAYVSHQRERTISGRRYDGPFNVRPDFLIQSTTGPIVVEVKNPTAASHELQRAVSQLLYQGSAYKRVYGLLPKMVLVSSRHHPTLDWLKDDYGIPVEYVLLNQQYAGVIVKQEENSGVA